MEYSFRRKSVGYRIYYACIIVFFILMAVIMLFPLWNVVVTSFATKGEILNHPLMLFPSQPTLGNFRYLYMDGSIITAYGVTLFTTVVGTFLSMAVTLMLAYGLAKRDLPGANVLHKILLASMFIDTGLIPFYMMVRNLGLTNSLWSSIVPSLVSLWNYLVIRSFFKQFPKDLEEAAMIDGASYGTLFVRVVLPLSMPVVATFTLYYAVDYWNSWYNCMLFNNKVELQTLQLYVYRFVTRSNIEYNSTASAFKQTEGAGGMNQEGIKAACCTAAVLPILIVYPFLQKYFAKGIMLGAIKG